MLDVHEVIAQFMGDLRTGDVAIDQLLDIGVRQERIVRVKAEFAIQNRVVIENGRRGLVLAIGPAKPPRMRQLQAEEQVVGGAELLAVRRQEDVAEFGHASAVFLACHKLVRVGAALGCHGECLPAPDELGPAAPEIPPAPARQIARLAVFSPIPPFHRLNGKAIADADAAGVRGLGQRGRGCGFDLVVAGQFRAQMGQVGAKVRCPLKAGDARIARLGH